MAYGSESTQTPFVGTIRGAYISSGGTFHSPPPPPSAPADAASAAGGAAGCFSHVDQSVNNELVYWGSTVAACQSEVCDVLGKPWFAMEWAEGRAAANIANCFWGTDDYTSEGPTSGCDAETNAEGRALGAAYKMAVYSCPIPSAYRHRRHTRRARRRRRRTLPARTGCSAARVRRAASSSCSPTTPTAPSPSTATRRPRAAEWTLVAKVAASDSTMNRLNTAQWRDGVTLGSALDLSEENALGQAYSSVPFSDVMIRSLDGGGAVGWSHPGVYSSDATSCRHAAPSPTVSCSSAASTSSGTPGSPSALMNVCADVRYGFFASEADVLDSDSDVLDSDSDEIGEYYAYDRRSLSDVDGLADSTAHSSRQRRLQSEGSFPPPPSPPRPPPPPSSPFYLRVSNKGATSWRPAIKEVYLYSDTSCSSAVAIPANGGWDDAATACPASGCDLCSGWDDYYGNLDGQGCQLAIDGDIDTRWRPSNYSGSGQTVWAPRPSGPTLRLPTVPTIACVQVLGNLGEESGGSNTWNGGLTLEASIDGVAFATLVRDDAAAIPRASTRITLCSSHR